MTKLQAAMNTVDENCVDSACPPVPVAVFDEILHRQMEVLSRLRDMVAQLTHKRAELSTVFPFVDKSAEITPSELCFGKIETVFLNAEQIDAALTELAGVIDFYKAL